MKDIIRSANNNFIKQINKFSKKKYRKDQGAFVIESRKLIDEAIMSNQKIRHFITREDKPLIFEPSLIVDQKLFDNISYLSSPDGYMAIVEKDQVSDLSEKILILDRLQDPGNMGTLIRSAEAFGFNTIIAIDSVDFYNEKVLRSSMGSIFRLNLIESDYDILKSLKDYEIYVGDMDGQDFRLVDLPNKMALVIGNEGQGISDEIMDLKLKTIKIPMKGRIESLNAGVSGSILMAQLGG